MNVLEIVEKYLKSNNFDGLVDPDDGCSCRVGDLAPCGVIGDHCRAGNLAPCPPECGEDCEFHIVAAEE